MKHKKIFLVSLLAVFAAGIGTASAFIVAGDSAAISTTPIDSAIVLDWGSDKSVGAITNLTPSSPAYRRIELAAPVKTTSVAGGLFTATLTKGTDSTKTADIRGLKIQFALSTWEAQTEPTEVGNITIGKDDTTTTTSSWSNSAAITEGCTYFMKITVDADAYARWIAAEATCELSGNLNLSYGAFVAA